MERAVQGGRSRPLVSAHVSFRIKTKQKRNQPMITLKGDRLVSVPWGVGSPDQNGLQAPQGPHVLLRGSQALAAPNPFPAPPYWPPAQLRIPPRLRVPVPAAVSALQG